MYGSTSSTSEKRLPVHLAKPDEFDGESANATDIAVAEAGSITDAKVEEAAI